MLIESTPKYVKSTASTLLFVSAFFAFNTRVEPEMRTCHRLFDYLNEFPFLKGPFTAFSILKVQLHEKQTTEYTARQPKKTLCMTEDKQFTFKAKTTHQHNPIKTLLALEFALKHPCQPSTYVCCQWTFDGSAS